MKRAILGRLLGLIASRRWWILAGAGLAFLAIGANVALIAMSAYLVSRAAIVTNVAELALAITAVRVLAIGRAAFRYLERYVTHLATLRILADVRVWFYAAIEPLAPARLATRRSGDLLAAIVADVETLEDFYVRVIVPPIAAALATAFACVLLGAFDVRLGLILLAFLVLTGVVLPSLTLRLARVPGAAAVGRRAALNAMVVDEIQGIAELAAFDQALAHRNATLALGDEVDAIAERLAVVRGLGIGLGALLASVSAVAILAVAVPLVLGGQIDGVYLALLPLAAIAAFEAVQPLSMSLQLLGANEAAAARLFAVVDAPTPVRDPSPAAEPALATDGPFRGQPRTDGRSPTARPPSMPAQPPAIEVRGLTFAYEPGARPVLDDIDLTVPSGGSLALVGPSGSGKSTLVNLLLRFWDYGQGEIRIGGRELHDLHADDVRLMLGVVSQRVHLFDATIRDNLALADAAVTDAEVEAACRLAQLHEFVATLPDGYETRIGEDGIRLSGGERRRLAIARAIIKDAPIVILDEATADVDAVTEERLMASLRPFLARRTTLLISHRPSFTQLADTTVVLERGRVVGSAP
jgi:thiol reductant ABC exporter CydC subunit